MMDETVHIWMDILSEYDADVIEKAVRAVLRTCKVGGRLPALALVVEAADAILDRAPQPKREDVVKAKAEASFSKLLSEVNRVGSYGSPNIDAETRAVMDRMGGWYTVCQWKTDELTWRKKEFIDLYISGDIVGLDAMQALDAKGVAAAVGSHRSHQQCLSSGANEPGGRRLPQVRRLPQ